MDWKDSFSFPLVLLNRQRTENVKEHCKQDVFIIASLDYRILYQYFEDKFCSSW